MKILTLKEKGKRALGINEAECDRHGGPEHRYWCGRVAGHLRASGYDVTEEAPIGGGKTVDLLAVRDGKRIAFEIETGRSDALANVNKLRAAGFQKIMVAAASTRVKEQLVRQLGEIRDVKVLTANEVIALFPKPQRSRVPTRLRLPCS